MAQGGDVQLQPPRAATPLVFPFLGPLRTSGEGVGELEGGCVLPEQLSCRIPLRRSLTGWAEMGTEVMLFQAFD